jgi:ADP-heptose:LPS heptosyltransferase
MSMRMSFMESRDLSGKESMKSVPWTSTGTPKKILIIRMQAFGDVVISLPYMQALQGLLPTAQFHILTREEFSSIPRTMTIFERVWTIGGGRERMRQWLAAGAILPALFRERYDIVIDLQRNSLSRMIRRLLHPKSYSEFDRYSFRTAGERTKSTIDKLGFTPLLDLVPLLQLRDSTTGLNKLAAANFNPAKKLFVLNPAGNFVTKNWPLEYYIQFARSWLETIDSNVQFAVIGMDSIREKAEHLKNALGGSLVSLVGSTTQLEAFNILQKADLVLTEDSGLMHMACVSRIPVIALFGSTKSVWSKPMGRLSVCLDSSDLECGECAQPACRFGDIHCLSRRTPDSIISIARELIQHNKTAGQAIL